MPVLRELTDAGKVMGTPNYMAPEQKEYPDAVDHRADIYALGVVFYQMLTGELPGKEIEPPSHKVQIDVRLDEVVLRALEKKPELRYQQASAMKTRVETIATSGGISKKPDECKTRKRSISSLISPFSSPDVREIAAHLTRAERNEAALYGFLWGIWVVTAIFGNLYLIRSFPSPGNWIVASVITALFLASILPMSRMQKRFLCSTAWAKENGYTESQIKLFSFDRQNLWKAVIVIAAFALFAIGQDKWMAHYVGLSELSKNLTQDAERTKRLQQSLAAKVKKASAEIWSPTLAPGEKPDLQKILDAAKSLTEEGSYEEALQRYLWYFKHSRSDVGQRGVRLSFALSDWVELGRRYPKAKQALIEIRDADVQKFSKGEGYFELFQEIANINHYLDKDDQTLALFKSIYQNDKSLARQCYFFAEDLLMKNGEYKLCLDSLGDPQAFFESLRNGFEIQQASRQRLAEIQKQYPTPVAPQFPGVHFTPPDLMQMATNNFVGSVCKLVEILVATGHKPDAEKIQDEALTVLDDPKLKSAVNDAEEKIRTLHAASSDAAQILSEQSPVVVETFPVSGARDVPPGETEIRVRFSKPMADDSWSWSSAWENSTPEFIGKPHYEADGKTCVVKVKLEPDKTYAFWLNSEKFHNFKDADGRPAIPYLLIFQTQADSKSAALRAAQTWLAALDSGNYSNCWETSSAVVQDAVPEATFVAGLNLYRQPLGALVSRHLELAQAMTQMPGAPDGHYVLMQFASTFTDKKSAIETVTFMQEKDGQWKSAGYFIK